jgi:ribosome-binding protein aMBF1 (putative translation factor)
MDKLETFDEYLNQQLKDPEFRKVYEDLDLPGQLAEQIIHLRQMRGLTQAELAQKVGTKQSGISRLESLTYLPSLSFLQRIAEVLGAQLEVKLVPRE